MGYKEILANDYNPYIHRERPGQLGNIIALVHLIKGILGTGILALPDAFKQAGWLVGTILNIALHIIVCLCLHIMFKGMYFMCKKNQIPYVSYAESMKQAFEMGPSFFRKFSYCAPCLVTFFLILYQFGTLCVYLLFSSSNLKMVIDDNTNEENHLGLWLYMCILLIPVMGLTFLKNLKVLGPFSNVANWLTLVSLLIVYYYVLRQIEPLGERDVSGTPLTISLFIGTSMFAILSLGIMLSIEQNMKDGSKWLGMFGVLNQAVFVVTILDTFTGLFGYWRYGDETESAITLNLGKEVLAWIVQAFYAISILISYALQAFPISEIVTELYIKTNMPADANHLCWDYVMRTIVVLCSFILAVPIPFLGLFISFFGSLCLSLLGLVFPSLMDICIRWEDGEFGKGKVYLVRDIFLICIGIFGGIAGSGSAINSIIKKFQEG